MSIRLQRGLLLVPLIVGVVVGALLWSVWASSPTEASTTVRASFASGSGANYLGVKVSNHGNLVSFESPAGKEAVFEGSEGYIVCSDQWLTVHGHDSGPVESGFGSPTFSQPNAGAFPLTVTRNTTDGKLRLKQVWSKPDATEKDVTLTMTLTNRSSATLHEISLVRFGNFDVGTTSSDRGAATSDSVWLWDDDVADLQLEGHPRVGLMLTALTSGTPHVPFISEQPFNREDCFVSSNNTPAAPGNYNMHLNYEFFSLNAGQSKTVKFAYSRM
jgi:hypothetical protein